MRGDFAPLVRLPRPMLEGFRAWLGELLYMNAMVLEAREAAHDEMNLNAMLQSDENFAFEELDTVNVEIMRATTTKLGRRYRDVLERQLERH